MPRLTDHAYIQICWDLRLLHSTPGIADCLLPQELRYLQDYFKFDEVWTTAEMLAHRKAVSQEQPSLPQSAGRAYAKLQAAVGLQRPAKMAVSKRPRPLKRQKHDIWIRVERRAEPDLPRLRRAILAVAIARAEAERQQQEDEGGSQHDAP